MRTYVAIFVTAIAGCGFSLPVSSGQVTDGRDVDAIEHDARVDFDAPPNVTCYGTGITKVCPITMPTGTVSLDGPINTDDASMCVPITGPNEGAVCVVAGQSVSLSGHANVRATGTRPLVVLSLSSILISKDAILDVASHRATGSIGAGGDDSGCIAGSAATAPGGGGASGGGYGGSFGAKGGDGASTFDGGQAGLAPAATPSPTVLRGGCAGGEGGDTFGLAGHGGGAVALIAMVTITIDGKINASGAGGLGGDVDSLGGGGGGSGGMIVLDATAIAGANTGAIFANGGGGGEGNGSNGDGDPGNDPPSATSVGIGGNGVSSRGGNGGDGSLGGAGNDGSQGDFINQGGSGGGGGGAGVIKLYGSRSAIGAFSPLPS